MLRRSPAAPPPSPPPPPRAAGTDPHSGQAASPTAPPPLARGSLVRDTSPPPPPAATAARAAAALVRGLPQSLQNCAAASFCRPQYWQTLGAGEDGGVIKLSGPIYYSTLACATCDSCWPRCLSRHYAAAPLASPVLRPSPPFVIQCTSPSSIPTPPSPFRRRIHRSCSAVSAAAGAMSRSRSTACPSRCRRAAPGWHGCRCRPPRTRWRDSRSSRALARGAGRAGQGGRAGGAGRAGQGGPSIKRPHLLLGSASCTGHR